MEVPSYIKKIHEKIQPYLSSLLTGKENPVKDTEKSSRCQDNEKWDPYFKKCRKLGCGLPGYVIRGKKCEKQCEEGWKWDPYFKKCRKLICALSGYVIRGKKCVKQCEEDWTWDPILKECLDPRDLSAKK
ncbi:hypothetical protein AVEN_66294-1 [Araneus ventricosus]|uniref:Sushi domain-containing protein n=1 Tax=Araneus ventricosus TaxID=182803 RepID=A0A4Y2W4W3_ARAVE|nr:hypothetical protein AVEN_66294-1 [Araneus ventricosus]